MTTNENTCLGKMTMLEIHLHAHELLKRLADERNKFVTVTDEINRRIVEIDEEITKRKNW